MSDPLSASPGAGRPPAGGLLSARLSGGTLLRPDRPRRPLAVTFDSRTLHVTAVNAARDGRLRSRGWSGRLEGFPVPPVVRTVLSEVSAIGPRMTSCMGFSEATSQHLRSVVPLRTLELGRPAGRFVASIRVSRQKCDFFVTAGLR